MVQHELETDLLPEQNGVKILLVGDPGVGKTSLIYYLVNNEYNPNVPPRLANITIPAEVTPDNPNVPLHIIDYSERDQTYDDLRVAIKDASVVCIVYTAGDEESLDKVATYWVPTVRKYQSDDTGNNYMPIILVANKVDLVEDAKPLDKFIQEFVDVEAFIEVSALMQKNVVELFSKAQKAAIYPLAPLFDPQLRILTWKCRSALINIFKLCDHDGDDLLSDNELNLFQENCFGTPLQRDALDDLKSIIKQSTMDGIVDDGMTQTGFLFLHTLSIDKGRHDFTWQVLRKFNYDNQLNAKSENLKLADDSTGNFSHRGSFSSNRKDSRSPFESNIGVSDEDSENLTHLDLSWIRERSSIIKAGLGLTVATFISMLAMKYLVQSSMRSSA